MRGADHRTEGLFSYLSCEERVPAGHPLRAIHPLVEAALSSLSGDFTLMYSVTGRPSIPPEKLLRALLLQAFYSVRSERQLMEQLDYNLLFRWFVGLSMDAPIWDVTVFTKNRDRLLAADVAAKFMDAALNQPKVRALLSDEHFSVDGTLIDAWASIKSFRPKDGGGNPPTSGRNGTRDFRGEKLSNATHASTSDPDARLYKKAPNQSAKLCHMGHLVMENRHGLVVDAKVTLATGAAEREAAVAMVKAAADPDGITLGGDKGYDEAGFVAEMQRLGVVAHVARNTSNGRKSAIADKTAEEPGYRSSIVIRKRIEEAFGWMKTIGMLRKTRHRGTARVGWMFTLVATAYDLIRLPKLLKAAA